MWIGDRFDWFVIVSDQMEHVGKITRIGGPAKDVRVEYDTRMTKKELTVCVSKACVKFSSGVEQSYPVCQDVVGSFEGNYGRQDEVGETGMFRRSSRRLQERRTPITPLSPAARTCGTIHHRPLLMLTRAREIFRHRIHHRF